MTFNKQRKDTDNNVLGGVTAGLSIAIVFTGLGVICGLND